MLNWAFAISNVMRLYAKRLEVCTKLKRKLFDLCHNRDRGCGTRAGDGDGCGLGGKPETLLGRKASGIGGYKVTGEGIARCGGIHRLHGAGLLLDALRAVVIDAAPAAQGEQDAAAGELLAQPLQHKGLVLCPGQRSPFNFV